MVDNPITSALRRIEYSRLVILDHPGHKEWMEMEISKQVIRMIYTAVRCLNSCETFFDEVLHLLPKHKQAEIERYMRDLNSQGDR